MLSAAINDVIYWPGWPWLFVALPIALGWVAVLANIVHWLKSKNTPAP